MIAVVAGLGASLSWTTAALVAHGPARSLGAFDFTRTQLVSAAMILVVGAGLTGAWASVDWNYWPAYVTASLAGVVVGNLAMTACLRRGGPRRSQLLQASVGPVSACLAWLILGEQFTWNMIVGGTIVVAGILMAILYGSTRAPHDALQSPLVVVVGLGLLSAIAQAIGLIAMKPVLDAGADPLAASAIRTGLAAIAITVLALWPADFMEPINKRAPGVVVWTIVAGILGYVVAVSLLLVALKSGNTGIAAIVGSLSPVVMLPIIWRMSRRPPWPAWFGAGLVVLGIIAMFAKS